MECPACRAPVPEGSRFCPSCGHALRNRTEERRIAREWSRHLGADRYRELRTMLAELRQITDPWADVRDE